MLDPTEREARTELIEAYLEAVDAEAFDRYRDIFAEDVVYYAMGQEIDGIDAMIEWYEETLTLSDMYHDYDQRLHDEPASVAYGEFGGTLPTGDSVSALGLDVFEFDDATTEITALTVYQALPPRM